MNILVLLMFKKFLRRYRMCIVCFRQRLQVSESVLKPILENICQGGIIPCDRDADFARIVLECSNRIMAMSDSGSDSDGVSGWTTEDEDEDVEDVVILRQALRLRNGDQVIFSVIQKEETVLVDPVKVASDILDTANLEESLGKMAKICSSFSSLEDSNSKAWVGRVFNAIPFEHKYRLKLIAHALKILNMSPGEFSRTTEQSIMVTRAGFRLFERDQIADSVCLICQKSLVDSVDLLSDESQLHRYLVCSGVYGPTCLDKFCYACWSELQMTYLGDHCPSCRVPIELIRPKMQVRMKLKNIV